MAGLMRILRSRFFLAVLCIILEFAQFVLLYEFFLPFVILGWIFHVGARGVYAAFQQQYQQKRIPAPGSRRPVLPHRQRLLAEVMQIFSPLF